MRFKIFGKEGAPVLMLIPGLGVSYEIFLPLIEILRNNFHIVAVEVDGFTFGSHTEFTSVDNHLSTRISSSPFRTQIYTTGTAPRRHL